MHHAARVIERLAKQWQARHAGCIERLQQLPDRLVLVDGDDICTRNHDVDDAQRAETKDAQEHLAFICRESAAVRRPLDRLL